MPDQMTPERFERELARFVWDAERSTVLTPVTFEPLEVTAAKQLFPPIRPIAYIGSLDLRELIYRTRDVRAEFDGEGQRFTFMGVPLYKVDADRWLQFAQDPR